LIKAEVIFDNYLLREGPGRLFGQVAMYKTGTSVDIIGYARGGEWVLVQTQDHRSGWMNIVGLQYTGDIVTLPVIAVDNAQVLHGHVYKPGQNPASAIGVSLAPAFSSDPNLQDAANTNEAGEWYFYIPTDKTGQWYVGPNAYSCKSNAVDASCSLLWKLPDAQTVTLPFTQDVSIEFLMN
jgi:hypothetical protein